jgi:hypothetical protein
MQRISDAQWVRIRDYLPKENIPERDVLRGILTQLANALRTPGEIDERDCFIAVTFASATVAVGDKA